MTTNESVTFEDELGTITITPRVTWRLTTREAHKKPRMYVWPDENFNVLEDLANRTRRPHAAWRKAVERLVAATGAPLDLTGMRWSQYAGCTCPCSPGFILKSQVCEARAEHHGFRSVYFDVSVELRGAPTVDPDKAPRQLVLL